MSARRPRPGRTLGLRISLYLTGLLVALTVSVTTLVVQAQRSLLTRHVAEEGRVVARLLAGSARLAVFSENRAELDRVLEAALSQATALEACALDRKGRLLARAGTPAAGGGPCGLGEAGATLPAAGLAAGEREDADAFVFWAPIVASAPYGSEEELYFGEVVPATAASGTEGYLAVRLSKAPLRRGIRQLVGRAAMAGLVFLLLGVAVTYRIVTAATRPLRALAAEVRGRGTPVEVAGGDEVGLLAGAYPGLLDALGQAFAELQGLRDALEEKVAERTAALADANAGLREAHDLLEEKVRERTAQLEETYRQLVHAEKLSATGRLAASVAHEFNNPVFGIRNVLQGLRARGLAAEERELVDMAVGECDRLSRLVRDLQSFSRPTSGQAEPVDLRRVVDAMTLLCAKELRRKRIALEVHFGDDVPPVRGVEDQLKQVVLNLLTNAADAIPGEGGTIRVSAERRGAEVVLRVADTGQGIRPEHLERIFDPFFTTKPAVKGTGLGLSVSYGIVRRHGGRLEVESEPETGATFTVFLPIEGGRQP